MSDISSRSLQLSSSKLYVEHNVSDSEVNVGNKRRKVSLSTPVAMELENPEGHLEPVVMKRKRTSGHSFEGKLKEKIVPAELALGQTEKLSCEETKQVPSNSKEGCLNQILPEQKQAVKDKGTGNEIDRLRKNLEKKCQIRMAKLFQKQGVQFEEFDRIWEKKRSDLQGYYKLQQSLIRSIYGIGSIRTNNKLKLLDGSFIAKVNELNLLENVERKKLKAEQLAARDEERQKGAQWLADCGSGEPTANHVPESLCLHSEEVGCDVINSLSTDPQNDPGVAFLQNDKLKNLCPRQIICALPASRESVPGEIEVVELSKEVPQDVPETVPIEIVDCASPVELINTTSNKGIDNGDAIGLPDALTNLGDKIDEANKCFNESSEQTKASWIPHHCTSLLPQASGDQIPCSSSYDIIQDIGAQVNSVQDQSAQVVENQNASPFEMAASVHVDTVTDVQPNIELHDQDLAGASQGEVANLQSSDKLQDQDATDLEDQTTPWIEVASSEPIDVVNPVLSSVGAPAVLNGEELLSVDVSPGCNEPPVVEVEIQSHNLERSSSQTAEIADPAMVSHESATQLVENRDLQSNHFGNGSESQVNLENISSQTAEITDTVLLSHESYSHIGENQDLQSNHFGIGSGSRVNLERISTQTAEITESVVVSHESSSQLRENRDLQGNHFGIGSGSQVNLERISSQTAEITDTLGISHETSSHIGENRDLQSNHFAIGSGSHVNLERISSQTAPITDTVLLPHESASQLGGNRELQSNHFGIGSESQVIHETSVEVSTSSWNNVNVSQIVANTVELPHQAGQQLGSVGNLHGSVNPFSRNQVTSFSPQPLYAASLQCELGMISKEMEQLQKNHDDMKLQLKSDCEKEALEMLARINRKYDLKFQEAEAEFSHKKNGLDKNRSIVYRNKLLAEVLGSNCRDLCLLQGIQQASPSSSMQHQNLQHSVRPPPMPMGYQPVVTSNIQQLLLSNPTRHTPITPSPIQTTQHAPSYSFAAASQSLRPLVINAITPTTSPGFGGNVRSGAPHLQPRAASFMPTPGFGGNVHSGAPHLQPRAASFMPTPCFGGDVSSGAPHLQPCAASFMPTPTFPSNFQRFQLQPSQSLQSPPPPMQPSTFQNRPQLQGEPPALLNPSLPAPGFLIGMDDRPNIPASSCLPQINSSFGSLEQSHLARLRNVQGNRASSAAVNTIFISDED